MNVRIFTARVALVALTAVLPLSSYAKNVRVVGGATAAASKKMITMTLKNNSAETRTVRVGDENLTLKAQESLEFKAPVGVGIYAVGDSASHKDGQLIVQISQALNGVTCSFS